MDVEIKRVVVSERQHGVALLLAVIEYPVCELPGGYFNTYYTVMRDNITEWLYSYEIPRVRTEYSEAVSGIHMPHLARYDYRLKCNVTCAQDAIAVECDFSYSRGGSPIKQSTIRQIWNRSDGLMLKRSKKS